MTPWNPYLSLLPTYYGSKEQRMKVAARVNAYLMKITKGRGCDAPIGSKKWFMETKR